MFPVKHKFSKKSNRRNVILAQNMYFTKCLTTSDIVKTQ